MIIRWRVYPRVCGGTFQPQSLAYYYEGLSPRVRGNLSRPGKQSENVGSIPACAGEPTGSADTGRNTKVYPRVCGGTLLIPACAGELWGLSPRVRGNPYFLPAELPQQGSIPACAGEPAAVYPATSAARVYPRVCGGTWPARFCSAMPKGLSPRVRGNPGIGGEFPGISGSIPACAGEPVKEANAMNMSGVYPRVCGGTGSRPKRCCAPAGLSPRVRGNRAGTGWAGRRVDGLSPRVRGNPAAAGDSISSAGSIPACAGEPCTSLPSMSVWPVYPRVCGGTQASQIGTGSSAGLSPRVRGNPTDANPYIRLRGSIPACAGEPAATGQTYSGGRVYPRVCGGTANCFGGISRQSGLSPRVRGNLGEATAITADGGSIPACAGEPGG